MMKRFALFCVAVLLTGCGFAGSVAKSVVYADHGGMSPSEHDATIRDSIDSELQREIGGEHPTAGKKTWTAYWNWRYALWRENAAGERWITYTRNRRTRLRLRYI
jgi:hypothetical protein